MDYKNTLNLPRTDFAMKADLVTREPQRLQKWEQSKLYERIQAARADAEKFVLHDGPPFANGDVHIGNALNKILKDIVVKYKTLRGFSAPYIPGWDCHGLPIEFKVSQELRKAGNTTADAATIRKACDTYARKYIDIQRTQFKRLGVLGDWDNPYLTLNKEYEADELRLFADIVEKGFVYRGKKPVYWSIPARTALAEAEVEYHDHISTSCYVKFPAIASPEFVQSSEFPEKLSTANTFVLIWTTTPWTLPANLAVALNPKLRYSLVQVGVEKYWLLSSLLPTVAEKCKWEQFITLGTILGNELEGLEYEHPFCKRYGEVFPADFVTSDTGTGFVHIAPGHGLDDYNLGRQLGLPIYSPVDDDGKLATNNDLPLDQQFGPELAGKSILEKGDGTSEANEAVLALLRERNRLAHVEPYSHSYPFCWRSKTPVIFRAMDQWFIKVDHQPQPNPWPDEPIADEEIVVDMFKSFGLRREALITIQKHARTKWIPDWGKNRILGAVATRPDWCISRQRTWGVPIPFFYDSAGKPVPDPSIQTKEAAEVVRNTAKVIADLGSNVWFEKSAAELWLLVKPKNWTGPEAVAKSQDTLDVWIDSGSSSKAVLKQRKELQHDNKTGDEVWQADLYLEGSDQHRGWFQSSLLLSLAGNGVAPYKKVLTHGFMVDEDREKISKSKQSQNPAYLKPQTAERYIKEYGADVIRLWVASQDYRNDIVVSEERLKKVSETYRGIRNALRYQLSNLYDFHPSHHAVADKDLTGLDRWILNEFAKLERDVLAAYDKYEFHVVYQRISQFVAVELSSQYHDIVKDRLYTDAANSPRRRSTQTALCHLVTGLTRLLAPILAYTADEAWEFVPGVAHQSVHEDEVVQSRIVLTAEEEREWSELFALRERVLRELEKARQSKRIGKSLDACVRLKLPNLNPTGSPTMVIGVTWGPPTHEKTLLRLVQQPDVFQELLNVSKLELMHSESAEHPLEIVKADGVKCERCWHWETDVGQHADHPTICGRCVEAVKQSASVA